jgi:hypothetical protein
VAHILIVTSDGGPMIMNIIKVTYVFSDNGADT